MKFLKHLTASQPPEALFGEDRRSSTGDTWTEDSIRLCLPLYLSLMPSNHHLIHPYDNHFGSLFYYYYYYYFRLATIYTAVNGDIKRVILRVLEIPVSSIEMFNHQLSSYVGSWNGNG